MVQPRTKLTPTSARTREQLILAGERLFAERGLDNVSLRQINAAAGQRNSSAAHYHFGSKEALVSAVYEYRLDRLNARRTAILADRSATSPQRSVDELVELVLFPIVEEIETTDGGRNFIQFLSQLVSHPTMNLVSMWRQRLADSLGQVYQELRAVLPEIPDEVFGQRFGLMWLLAVKSLADRERIRADTDNKLKYNTPPVVFISNLADALKGLITAPVSAATKSEILRLYERKAVV